MLHKFNKLTGLLSVFALLTLSLGAFGSSRFSSLEERLNNCNSDTLCLRLSIALCDSIIFNDPDQAKNYAISALELATNLSDTAAMAKTNNQLGVVATIKGLYLTGIEHYQLALSYYRVVNDEVGIAKALNNIGVIYTSMENNEEAAKNYREALVFNSKRNDHTGVSLNLYNLSVITAALNDYAGAEMYADSLRAYQRLHGKYISDSPLFADIFLQKGQLDSAEYYYKKSIAEHRHELDESQVANDFIGMARLKIKQNKFEDALYNLITSEKLCLNHEFNDTYLSLLSVRAEAYAGLQRFEEAFKSQTAYIALDDSLTKMNNFSRISELNARYEAEKRDRQIAEQEGLLQARKAEELFRQRIYMLIFGCFLTILIIITVSLIKKRKTNKLLQTQNNEITQQRHKILSSINYALKIQNSILVPEDLIRKRLPESFIYLKPKDIVSGDFYWFAEHDDKTMLATIDCTGHGVPGAFMSLIAYAKLNKIVNEQGHRNPGSILTKVHEEIMLSLNQNEAGENAQDGMDMSFCIIDHAKKSISFSGARNPIVVVRKGEMLEIKADALSIGGKYFNEIHATTGGFSTQEIDFETGDCLYLFTDGYMDQFGGTDGKKMNKARFRDILAESCKMDAFNAKNYISDQLESWRNTHTQLDDILVIGVRL